MGQPYRSWAERREIIRAVIARTNPPPLEAFQLTDSEEVYYQARSARAIDRLARQSSSFKAYYRLPTAKPFGLVVSMSALIAGAATIAAIYLLWHDQDGSPSYPLLAACATVTVAAIGWVVGGWITHRNTIRQNTNNILFARFSQAPFGEALHRFHQQFGWKSDEPVTSDDLAPYAAPVTSPMHEPPRPQSTS